MYKIDTNMEMFLFQQYKILAQKISLIEQKAVKSPQDEADLAELQAKQHQILSTGRPVFGQQPQPQQAPPPPQQLPQHPAPLQPNVVAPVPSVLTSLAPAPAPPPWSPLWSDHRRVSPSEELKHGNADPNPEDAS